MMSQPFPEIRRRIGVAGLCGLAVTALLVCSFFNVSPVMSQSTVCFSQFQERAKSFGSVLELPVFERTPSEIQESVRGAIQRANAALDRLASLTPETVSFNNTCRALDGIFHEVDQVASRAYLLKEVSPNPELRKAATDMIKEYQDWAVGLDYREDVYRAVRAYADDGPELAGEDALLLEETLKEYERAGLGLPREKRNQVEEARKKLSQLSTDFDTNITNAEAPVLFTREELEGVPQGFLDTPGIRQEDGTYRVEANITYHYMIVMGQARLESTRKKLFMARFTLAREENRELLAQIVSLRHQIATLLGYASWADYRIEPKMAKNEAIAREFLEELAAGLEPKFRQELEEFRDLKIKETGDAQAQIHSWDWRYYENLLKKEKYSVDAERLKEFFVYDKVLLGMFRLFEDLFSLKIEKIDPPYRWVDDLELYVISDSVSGEPMGALYLDMFPRDGKFNHFAQFGLISGKRYSPQRYQRPVAALICNFPPPSGETPSLLTHSNVETLFHEFGHALHTILTRAKHGRFSGTSVPRDFVEAPSQMLENWVWEKKVLDTFAEHYQDPTQKIPEDLIQKLKAAKLATVGTFYRRQLSFGLLDLVLHGAHGEGPIPEPVSKSNEILGRIFIPVPEETSFATYFGHLTGYDGGYYGYAWADAISADMATVFETAPNQFYDREVGMRLRNEIYAPGGSRDVNISIEKFLGRSRSMEPFLKSMGIGQSR